MLDIFDSKVRMITRLPPVLPQTRFFRFKFIIIRFKEFMLRKQFQVVHLNKLKIFLDEIGKKSPTRNIIKLIMKNLNIDVKDANLQFIMNLAIFVEKRAQNFPTKKSQYVNKHHWAFGEQKLFYIILPYIFFFYGLNPNDFKQKDIVPLENILISKTSIQLYFEVKNLETLANHNKNNWNQEDCQVLTNLVSQAKDEQQESMKWKNIAVQLFIKNGGIDFHSPRDCREMWTNHLNPKITKKSWDIKEDCELFSYIQEYGCKWSLISKKMKSMRTQHMVKNRANSIIKKYKFKSKRLNDRQTHKIFQDLKRKLIQVPNQFEAVQNNGHIYQPQAINQQMESNEAVKQEVQRQENKGCMQQIFQVLDLSKERILIGPTQIQQNWQYSEDQPINFMLFDINGLNNRLLTFDEQMDFTNYSINSFNYESLQD